MMKVLVTGVTRTGNLGGAAMLCAVCDILSPKVESITLASILPEIDRKQSGADLAQIGGADYRYLVLAAAPLCLLLWPIRNLAIVRRLLAKLPWFRDVEKTDVTIDLSGIAFVDGRGLALLAYNTAVVLPSFFFGKPVYKLSQALGPFETIPNRLMARWVLTHCKAVHARGKISLKHVHALGIPSAVCAPDVSYALIVPDELREYSKTLLAENGIAQDGRPILICSPSVIVDAQCRAVSIDMAAVFVQVFEKLTGLGWSIALLPHSEDKGIRKNGDMQVCQLIADFAKARGIIVPILDAQQNPRLARAIVANATVFLASRFHSMIAAFSQSVPTVTVGWSHKYEEAAEAFSLSGLTIDFSEIEASVLIELILRGAGFSDAARQSLQAAADVARTGAIAGIECISRDADLVQ